MQIDDRCWVKVLVWVWLEKVIFSACMRWRSWRSFAVCAASETRLDRKRHTAYISVKMKEQNYLDHVSPLFMLLCLPCNWIWSVTSLPHSEGRQPFIHKDTDGLSEGFESHDLRLALITFERLGGIISDWSMFSSCSKNCLRQIVSSGQRNMWGKSSLGNEQCGQNGEMEVFSRDFL